jgi:hypothetical protein
VRWILGWGDAIEVIAPDSVRRQVDQILRMRKGRFRPPDKLLALLKGKP